MENYNELFVEQIVRRRRKMREILLKVGTVVAAIILIIVSFLLLWNTVWSAFFPTAFALICILVFFAFHYTRCEFEYSYTGGQLHIDKITGKRHRKRVFAGDTSYVVDLGPCTKENSAVYGGQFQRKVDVSMVGNAGKWFFISEPDNGARTLVIFSPSERMIAAFRLAVPARRRPSDRP